MYKTHLGALVGSFEWVFSHCQLLGVLEGRVWVKILKVFHRVLSDTQAPNSGLGLGVKNLCQAYLPDLRTCLHQNHCHHCCHCLGCPTHRRRERGVPN